jgi:hypothetical protein
MIGLALFGFLIAAGISSYLELTEVESREYHHSFGRDYSLSPQPSFLFSFF